MPQSDRETRYVFYLVFANILSTIRMQAGTRYLVRGENEQVCEEGMCLLASGRAFECNAAHRGRQGEEGRKGSKEFFNPEQRKKNIFTYCKLFSDFMCSSVRQKDTSNQINIRAGEGKKRREQRERQGTRHRGALPR